MKRTTISIISVLTYCAFALSVSSAMADDEDRQSSATVSFGKWDPNDPELSSPLDRLLADPAAGVGNNHLLVPKVVTITEGGAVNFIISGGHVLAVYDHGTKPKDIDSAIEPACAFPLPTSGITTPCSPVNNMGMPVAGGILSDTNGRIYRGTFLNTNPARRDGVEVVQFSKPGTYLVICARANHFFNPVTQKFEMFGFVKVEKDKHRR
jgi:hypothetical protein